MRVTFSAGTRKLADGTSEETEFVCISTGRDGKDVVSRLATDADKARWPEEYAAFAGTSDAPPTETAPAAAPGKKQKPPKG